MTILVTGGTGVIGAPVLRELAARGETVVSVSSRADPGLLGDAAGAVVLERGDVRDGARMRDLLQRHHITVVIHLAALMPAVCRAQPSLAVEVNVRATAQLYEVAGVCGVERFVYASSKSAYGPELPPPYGPPEFRPIPEDLPPRPIWVYDVTKRAGELMIEAQRRAGGPEATSLRFATIYGPGKGDRYGGASVLSSLLEMAIAGGRYAIPRGGDQVDDVIWVGDAAGGIVAAALYGDSLAPLYNIATGHRRTIAELVAEVGVACPQASLDVGPGLHYMGEEPTYGVLDPTRARTELGFTADPDMARGVRLFGEALGALSA